MASPLDGDWDCTIDTPMGAQRFTLGVTVDGDRFSARASGGMGSIDIPDGTVDGDRLAWAMSVAKPMPLKLTCDATIDGDDLTGKVSAGIFGTFPVTGRRAG